MRLYYTYENIYCKQPAAALHPVWCRHNVRVDWRAALSCVQIRAHGYVLTRTRSFDEAANAYKKAIEISPQAKYWKGLGDVYAMKNLAQDHKRIVASPWNLNPKKETTYDQSDNSDRIEAYRQAVKLDQDYVPAWFLLAQVLNTARKCGEAEEAIAEIRKRDPAKALELASWHRRKYGPCEGR